LLDEGLLAGALSHGKRQCVLSGLMVFSYVGRTCRPHGSAVEVRYNFCCTCNCQSRTLILKDATGVALPLAAHVQKLSDTARALQSLRWLNPATNVPARPDAGSGYTSAPVDQRELPLTSESETRAPRDPGQHTRPTCWISPHCDARFESARTRASSLNCQPLLHVS
jgi:hypothetical protein